MARRKRESFAGLIIIASSLISGSVALIIKAVEGMSMTAVVLTALGFFLTAIGLLLYASKEERPSR